jgi:tetratricopeptide (TPR) repeat protein
MKNIFIINVCLFHLFAGVALGEVRGVVVPMTPDQRAAIASAHGMLADAARAEDRGDFKGAEFAARHCLASTTIYSGKAQLILAAALLAEGKYKDSAAIFSRICFTGEDPSVTMPYALSLLKSGQWSQALNEYRSELPRIGSRLFNASDLLATDNDFDASHPNYAGLEADIRIAMGFASADSDPVSGRHFPERNLAEFRKALALEPDSPLAKLAYAEGLEEIGRRTDAASAFSDVASGPPGEAQDIAKDELSRLPMPKSATNPK